VGGEVWGTENRGGGEEREYKGVLRWGGGDEGRVR